MIEINESYQSIFNRLGLGPIRHNRAKQCPFQDCESSSGFALSEAKGAFHCFKCGRGGDRIRFIQEYLRCDFKDALRFLGIEPGKPPRPDPEITRRERARKGLLAWARTLGKQLRYEFYVREKVITRAISRLELEPEDAWGWNWLGWALTGHAALEHTLDMIDSGSEAQRLRAYCEWRRVA